MSAATSANGPVLFPPPQPHHAAHTHSVQFYEGDSVLLDGLVRFIGSALGAGDSAIVIATKEHRDALLGRLFDAGVDISIPLAQGRFIQLDAAETLSKFMVDGWPDAKRFAEVVGSTIEQLAALSPSSKPEVAAFGEMVALLWMEGKADAAIRLEQLWNELAHTHTFTLHCAYPLHTFGDSTHVDILKRICAEHSSVIPAESFTGLSTDEERLRSIAVLQQKAQVLEVIADERERLALALAAEVEELKRLHELASRLSWLDVQAAMADVLQAVATLHKTGMGLLFLCARDSNELYPAASLGFSEPFLARVAIVCKQERKRIVVRDTDTDPRFVDCRDAAKAAGFRAVHSTPLLDRNGELIGVLSVHFPQRYSPTDHETRLTDLYARLAVNAVENSRLYSALQQEFNERKKAEEALIQAEKLAATGRLAATIAHEINNPLEAITNYIFLAKKHPELPARVKRNLDFADEELARVAHIAQQTLGFYRDNSQPRETEVAAAIRDVITIYQRKIEYKKLTVECDIGVGLKAWVLPGELKQAVSNLVANAIDASREGGRLKIRARFATNSHPRVRISVADNGSGMSEDVKGKVFTPFFTTKQQVGTGLGLWTTRNLLEKQGGAVRLRSREGRGTVVSLFLPTQG